jgi:hypothetical protein
MRKKDSSVETKSELRRQDKFLSVASYLCFCLLQKNTLLIQLSDVLPVQTGGFSIDLKSQGEFSSSAIISKFLDNRPTIDSLSHVLRPSKANTHSQR